MDLGGSDFSWTAVNGMVSRRWLERPGGETLLLGMITYRRRTGTLCKYIGDEQAFLGLNSDLNQLVNLWEAGDDDFDDDE